MSKLPAVVETKGGVLDARPSQPPTPADLIQQAIEKGIPVEGLEKLTMLFERMEDRAAVKEFASALASFQEACPPITKESKASIVTKSGTKFSYQFASLDHIADTVRPLLRQSGLSYSWDSSVEGETLTCTCTLRHVNGHRESASFQSPTESRAGMSDQQKFASALSFARRQSLIQVLGLTTTDPDTDAASTATITANQAADIDALIDETKADRKRFLKYMGVGAVEAIPANEFSRAISALEQKRRAK